MPFTSKKRNVKHSTGIGYDFLPSCFDEFWSLKLAIGASSNTEIVSKNIFLFRKITNFRVFERKRRTGFAFRRIG